MLNLDKTGLEACAAFGYLLATMAMLAVGSSQGSWLNSAGLHTIKFRKPALTRSSMGMSSLLFLMIVIVSGKADHHSEIFFFRFWCIPWCLALSLVFAYLAGPQDVSVDLETRTCQETKGWIFRPRKNVHALSETSCVCILNGEINNIFLLPGGGRDKVFVLGQPFRSKDAPALAQKMADELCLPVKNATWKTLRGLA